MAFLSYAQNFEDVMLWRALGHIPNGLYVDVGAQHPRIDSVSRAFYEHGWRGVHVEPVPEFARLLRADRPDETVLQAALGEAAGTLELNVFADTGLSTAVAAYADRHVAERHYEVERIQVPVLTLASALASLEGREVHWLKIDVEGFEEQVLRGWDSQALRPWVIVVEATLPNLPETDFAGWDPILVAAHYSFVYFDGLNRFYVAAEHPELVAAFAVPPNVFDAVELSGLASWGLARPVLEQRDILAVRVAELEALQEQSSSDHAHTTELLRQSKSHTADLAAQLETSATVITTMAREVARFHVEAEARGNEQTRLLDEHRQVESLLNSRLAAVIAERGQAMAKILELNHQVSHWSHSADALTRQMDVIYSSRSWRAAAPLRAIAGLVRRARRLAGKVKRRLMPHAAPVLPAVALAAPVDAATAAADRRLAAPVRKLSPHAESVYSDLKKVVDEPS